MRKAARLFAWIVLVAAVLTTLLFVAIAIDNDGDSDLVFGGMIGAALAALVGIGARNAEVALRERRVRTAASLLEGAAAGASVVLRPRRWPAALSLVIAVAVGAPLFVGAVEDGHPVPIAGALLCAAGAAYSAWALLPGAEYLRVTRDGLVVKRPLGKRRYAWGELGTFRTVAPHHGVLFGGTHSVSFDHGVGGESVLPDNFGMDPQELADALNRLRSEHAASSG